MYESLKPIDRFAAAGLGIAIALTSATQLRFGGTPVGVGELALLVYVVYAVSRILLTGQVCVSAFTRTYTVFWLIVLITLCLGWTVALGLDLWNPGSIRDAVAFVLSCMLMLSIVSAPHQTERLLASTYTLLPVLLLPMMGMLALSLVGRHQLGPIDSLFGLRFTGWALNPNQLALFCLPMPAFALLHFRLARSRAARAWHLFMLGGAVVVGLATLSDALWLAWGVAVLILCAAWWSRAIAAPSTGGATRALALIVIPSATVLGGASLGSRIYEVGDQFLRTEYTTSMQGVDRFARWNHGLVAGSNSPVVGLGPGSYSGPFAPFSGEEAHNTFIDWFASTGLVGLLAFLALCSWSAIRIGASDSLTFISVLAALGAFMMLHFVARQPVFWFYVLSLVALAGSRARPVRRYI